MSILSILGLKSPEPATDWEAKFKTAIKDLAARDDELDNAEKRIEGLLRDATARAKWNKDITDRLAKAEAEIAALRPDAEAMRAKRKRDREQKAAKKGAA